MAKSKFKSKANYRQLPFKNRHNALSDIRMHLHIAQTKDFYLKVIPLIGPGGSGKSRILAKVKSEAVDMGFKVVQVSLETEASMSCVAPLKAMRDQLSFDCFMFDVALLRYWSSSGQILQLDKKSSFSNSISVKALENFGSLMGIASLPISFAIDVFSISKSEFLKANMYSKEEFENIDAIRGDSIELLDRLPYFLALDIERNSDIFPQKRLFLYDSYEKQHRSTQSKRSPWLREFIGSMDDSIHIISSREKINWPKSEWANDITQPVRLLPTLPEVDAIELFRETCNPSTELIPTLLEISRCVPFYIEVLINNYLSLMDEATSISVDHLPSTSESAVLRLISHYNEPYQKIIIILGVIQYFDKALLNALIRQLNLPIDMFQADEICKSFFIEWVDEKQGLLKTHDLFTDLVRSCSDFDNYAIEALHSAATVMYQRVEIEKVGLHELMIFFGICRGGEGRPKSIEFTESMIDFGYVLYDHGYWSNLSEQLGEFSNNRYASSLVQKYFLAISLRRRDSVNKGLKKLRTLTLHSDNLGRHGLTLDIEIAYLTALSGKYKKAKKILSKAYNQFEPFSFNLRSHRMACLYYAGILLLDGNFSASERILIDAIARADSVPIEFKLELMRHRAHTLRFSYMFEEAESIYMHALTECEKLPSIKAKLYTNLAETRCWFLPEVAIENCIESIKLNTRLDNKIELSKAYSAYSISCSSLGFFSDALKYQEKSLSLARQVNYPAGELFSLVSQCIYLNQTGHTLDDCIDAIQRLSNKIGAYKYLRLFPYFLLEEKSKFKAQLVKNSWLLSHKELKTKIKKTANLLST